MSRPNQEQLRLGEIDGSITATLDGCLMSMIDFEMEV